MADVIVAVLLYFLLKPVSSTIALIAGFSTFALVSGGVS